jgi:hypothetical protein
VKQRSLSLTVRTPLFQFGTPAKLYGSTLISVRNAFGKSIALFVPAEYASLLEVGLPLTVTLDQTGD